MKINAATLENSYYKWLKEDLTFTDVEKDFVAISTPFVDSDFDNINLYAEINGDNITVTDLGYTLFNLDATGVAVDRKARTRYKIFSDIISAFGVSDNNGRLEIETSLDRFPVAKNRLLQAVMRINDITYLATNNVKTAFNDVVSEYLDANEILYTEDIEIPGAAGVSSFFDFAIPNRADGERLVKTVARPNDLNQAKAFNFDAQSVSVSRPEAKFVYLIDNVSRSVKIQDNIFDTVQANVDEGITMVLPYSSVLENNNLLVNK